MHISLNLLFLGSAEAYIGWRRKLNGCLMARCHEYVYQNYHNLLIGFQVTVKNVGDAFLGHSVVLNSNTYRNRKTVFFICSIGSRRSCLRSMNVRRENDIWLAREPTMEIIIHDSQSTTGIPSLVSFGDYRMRYDVEQFHLADNSDNNRNSGSLSFLPSSSFTQNDTRHKK